MESDRQPGIHPLPNGPLRKTTITNSLYLSRLRKVSLVEGVSTLVLFGVAMPLKYLAGMPLAVTIVGSVHGGLFVLLSLMFLGAIRAVPLSSKLALLGIVAAIFPFGPFVLDARLRKLDVNPQGSLEGEAKHHGQDEKEHQPVHSPAE